MTHETGPRKERNLEPHEDYNTFVLCVATFKRACPLHYHSYIGSNLLSLFVMNERQEEVLICDEGSYVRHCCQVHMCYHSCDLHRDSDLKSMRVVRGAHNNMVVWLSMHIDDIIA